MGQVVRPEELAAVMEPYRKSGAVIVATNGVFDILHVGHVRYLQAARFLGDCLVVAVNSDASVQRLKGPSRPIVPQAERMEMLAALSCVDVVVPFDEDSPIELLEGLAPTIYVKGGDYANKTLPEAPRLEARGTRIQLLPLVEDRSTTNIVEKIKAQSV